MTLSPGKMRMKLVRSLPEMCASRRWPFSSSTRKVAVGQSLDHDTLNFDDVFFRQALTSSCVHACRLAFKGLDGGFELIVAGETLALQDGGGGGHMPLLLPLWIRERAA